jgi:formylglycine-generating enzyme required for sulfatase activity
MVTVPAGALDKDKMITITADPSSPVPAGVTVVGTPYLFGPEGLTFSRPVTVTLLFDATRVPARKSAKNIDVFTAPVGSTSFSTLSTTVIDPTHVSAPTTHFSIFLPAIPNGDAGAPDASEKDSGGDSAPDAVGAVPPFDAGGPSTGSMGTSCPDAGELGCGSVAIPAGSFVMGDDPMGYDNDTDGGVPTAGTMTISGFTLDAYEVTVARFRRFWTASPPHPAPISPIIYPGGSVMWAGPVTEPLSPEDMADAFPPVSYDCTWSETVAFPSLEHLPITCVDWYTAQAFCAWDGGRLPTEAEWEYAARGTSPAGLTPERNYPWGAPDPSTSCDRCQWDECPGDDGTDIKQVGSFAPSSGLYDMAGNVWEWAADWYAPYTDPTCWNGVSQTNPICGHATPEPQIVDGGRVIRGGTWTNETVNLLHSASRGIEPPATTEATMGFRCARTP